MSEQDLSQQHTPQSSPPLKMIRALGLVSTICGIIIVTAYQMTFSAVEDNKRIATERSIYQVIPNAKKIEEFLVENSPNSKNIIAKNQQNSTSFNEKFFAAYDKNNNFIGVAMEGSARGYGDNVRLMFAFDPKCECFNAMSVIAMRETPGIGDKITKDKAFLENFTALSAKLNEQQTALQNEIKTVKNGQKQNAWEIDAISGATITSRAVGMALNNTAQKILPALMQPQNLEKLQNFNNNKNNNNQK